MPRKTTTPIEMLVENLHALGVGEHRYKLDDGDRSLEIVVRVTRRASWDDNKKHAADALAFLSAQPYWTGHTECRSFRAKRGGCSRSFTHAVVSRGWDGKPSYSFCCRQHADMAKVDKNAVAVVELPRLQLEQARRAAQQRAAVRARQVCTCGHERQQHRMSGCDGGVRGTPRCGCSEERFVIAARPDEAV